MRRRAPTSSSPATGNVDVLTVDHMRAMKDQRHPCATSALRSEIQVSGPALIQMEQREAAGRRDRVPDGHRIIFCPKAPGEPRQRDGSPELRYERVVHQPDARADWSCSEIRASTRRRSTSAEASRREGRPPASRQNLAQAETELTDKQSDYITVPNSKARSRPDHVSLLSSPPPRGEVECEALSGGAIANLRLSHRIFDGSTERTTRPILIPAAEPRREDYVENRPTLPDSAGDAFKHINAVTNPTIE